jgi:decaprenylphospho-beta-D-erythro-pentofuranosid-2-ulose 2-reductase
MIDALGSPQSVLLLGGTSDIALATAQRWAATRPGLRVIVAARPSDARDDAVRRLADLGADASAVHFDARDTSSHAAVVKVAAADADIDVALIAFGLLGDAEEAWQVTEHAVELAEVNYVGAVSCGIALADQLRAQGHGTIVALSSVAGERVRRSNFVYGSTKAGMDGFFLGLGEAVRDDGVKVVVVRPGFVRTKMTRGLPDPPLAVDASDVAAAIVDAVATRRELVWVPSSLRYIMSGLRHVPRPVFRRLPI